MGLGALGAIAGGINRGMDWAQRDQEIEDQRAMRSEDREYQRGIRGFQQQQNQRTLDEQGRQDALRNELTATPEVGSEYEVSPSQVDMTTGNAVPAVKKTQTAVSQARQQAAAYQKADNADKARELYRWADDAAARSVGRQALGVLAGMPATSTPYDVLNALQKNITDDPSPIGVRDVVKADDKGGVTATFYNKNTGYSVQHTFNDMKSLQDAVLAHYSPEMYNKLIEKRQTAADKIAEEQSKGVVVPAGGQFIPGTGDKRPATVNTTGMVPTAYDADGNPTAWARAGSAGAGAGGKGADPMKAINDAFELAATKGETKLQPAQIAQGQRIAQDLSRNGIDSGLAVEVGLEVATDPTKARLEINKRTGDIDLVYQNPRVNRGQPITISRGAGTIEELEKAAKAAGDTAALTKAAASMVDTMVAPIPEAQREASRSQIIQIATNPDLRKEYLRQAGEAGKDVGVITRQLDLVGRYLKPQAQAAHPGEANRRPWIGGITPSKADPNSPAGRFQARQDQARQQAADRRASESAESQRISEQFQKDKATMPPLEFARKYDAMRMKLNSADAAELRRIEKGL